MYIKMRVSIAFKTSLKNNFAHKTVVLFGREAAKI